MNKININMVMKNITAILCALIVLALLLPFGSVSGGAEVDGIAAEGGEMSMSGINLVFHGGFLCILMVLYWELFCNSFQWGKLRN